MIKWIGFFLSFFVGRILHPTASAQSFGQGFGREAVDLIFDRSRVLMRVAAIGWISSLVFTVSLAIGLLELSRVDGVTPIYVSPTFGTALVLFLLSIGGFVYAGSSRVWKDARSVSNTVRRREEVQLQNAGAPQNPLVDAVVQLIQHYIATHPADRAHDNGAAPRGREYPAGERERTHFDA